jgi:signal transduction histidine kinase
MGLAIVRKGIERMDGQVGVQSQKKQGRVTMNTENTILLSTR